MAELKERESYKKILEVLGSRKMTRKELVTESGLTNGQIAGCIHQSKKENAELCFSEGVFYLKTE